MGLFDKIPEKIFRPLAAANRNFYAALLLHLYEHTFATIGDTPRRTDVIAEIGDFMDRYAREFGPLVDDDLGFSAADLRSLQREAGGHDTMRYSYFRYLVDSGWLVEMRDRYRKLVDLGAEGRLLLREFQRIVNGDTRSYGGAVLNVLAQLDAATNYPDDRSESLYNAWAFAHDFSHHLRTIATQMNRVEQHVLAQKELRALFRAFFDEFVTKVLIADYKTLKTRNNPFRFRHQILERVRDIESDPLLIIRLARGYQKEGRGSSAEEAEIQIRQELQDIYHTFDSIDRQLDIIGDTQTRIERKIHTIVRYMDRHDGGAIDRATRAIRNLAEVDLPFSADLNDLPAHLIMLSPLLGGDVLFAPAPKRREIERSRFRNLPMDPGQEAFNQAKIEYARRVAVSPQKLREFLERVMGGRTTIMGSEIEIDTVDDFVVFQRLREIPFMFNGQISRQFTVEAIDGRFENRWLDFPDFRISRVEIEDQR